MKEVVAEEEKRNAEGYRTQNQRAGEMCRYRGEGEREKQKGKRYWYKGLVCIMHFSRTSILNKTLCAGHRTGGSIRR